MDATAAAVEAVILGLRLDAGLSAAEADAGPARAAPRLGVADGPRSSWSASAPRVRLTTRGRLLSNELFARLV